MGRRIPKPWYTLPLIKEKRERVPDYVCTSTRAHGPHSSEFQPRHDLKKGMVVIACMMDVVLRREKGEALTMYKSTGH